jgi:hypothetical protein
MLTSLPNQFLHDLQVYVSRNALRNFDPLMRYTRKFAAELMHISRLDAVMMYSRKLLVLQCPFPPPPPQMKPSCTSVAEARIFIHKTTFRLMKT